MLPQHKRVSDPSLTRKGGIFSHPASWIYLILCILFCAYVFGFISQDLPDRFFQAIYHQKDHVLALSTLIVPAGIIVLALITVLVVSRMAGNVANAVHHKAVTRGRSHVSLQQFTAQCAPYEIGGKVAAQTYKALRDHYRGEMRIDLEDNLLQDLHLGEAAVHDLVGNLLIATNRIKDIKRPYDIATVLDLAMYVDGSPAKFLAQVGPEPIRSPRPQPVAPVASIPIAPVPLAAVPIAPLPMAAVPIAPAQVASVSIPQPAEAAAAPRRLEAVPPLPAAIHAIPQPAAIAKPAASRTSTGFLAPFRLPEELRAKVPRHVSVLMPAFGANRKKRAPKGSPFSGGNAEE